MLITVNLFDSEEICDETVVGNLTMCPRCDQNCPFWQLKQSCLLSKITYMFDNTGTVFFTIFMSFWGELKAYNLINVGWVLISHYLLQRPCFWSSGNVGKL